MVLLVAKFFNVSSLEKYVIWVPGWGGGKK